MRFNMVFIYLFFGTIFNVSAEGIVKEIHKMDSFNNKISISPINIKDGDIYSLSNKLKEISVNSGFSYNYEMICQRDKDGSFNLNTVIIKDLAINEGSYSIYDLLEILKIKISGFEWIRDDNIINIKINLLKDVKNPFDLKIKDKLDNNISFPLLFNWLNEKYPDYFLEGIGAMEEGGGEIPYRSCKANIDMKQGITVREIANIIGEQNNFWWIAIIFDKPSEYGYFDKKENKKIKMGEGNRIFLIINEIIKPYIYEKAK